MNQYQQAVQFVTGIALVLSALFHPVLCNVSYSETKNLLDSGWTFYFAGTDSSNSYCSPPIHKTKQITIPHMFPVDPKNGSPLQGIGWYYYNLANSPSYLGKDPFLDFEGVCLRSDVYVNGKRIGGNNYAYMPFSIDLSQYLLSKTEINIAIRIDNRLRTDQIPDTKARGWWLYGGIIRPVHLVVKPKQRIEHAQIRTYYRSGDTFDISLILILAETLCDSVIVLISSKEKKHSVHVVTMHSSDTSIGIGGVQTWTPETPFLYTVSFIPFFHGNAGDTSTYRRGFCQLTVKDDKLFLNGKPYHLRGISRHDVIAGKGPLVSRQERLVDFLDIKSMGVNFLRIAHFPQDKDVYEICDSLGLLVMEEIPAWKTDSRVLASDKGKAYASEYMRQLINEHGNYTCICLWSLGNQINSFKKSVAGFVEQVALYTKKQDPSRLVTFCSYCYMWDKAYSFIDIISINEYFGWELASLSMLSPMLRQIHKDWPNKPILISEIGAQASLGLREDNPVLAGTVKSMITKDLSEDHQALFIRSHLDTIEECGDYICGEVIWAYADYKSYLNKARTASMPFGLNACGLVTEDRRKKQSYYSVIKYFGKK